MDPRQPCTYDPAVPDRCHPFVVCDAPLVYTCTSRGACYCSQPAPTLACTVTITYPAADPSSVTVSASDQCAASLEIALAALLARLLR